MSFSEYNCIVCVAGIIYDVIVEPPSIGSTTDEHGHSKPVWWFLLTYFISVYCKSAIVSCEICLLFIFFL